MNVVRGLQPAVLARLWHQIAWLTGHNNLCRKLGATPSKPTSLAVTRHIARLSLCCLLLRCRYFCLVRCHSLLFTGRHVGIASWFPRRPDLGNACNFSTNIARIVKSWGRRYGLTAMIRFLSLAMAKLAFRWTTFNVASQGSGYSLKPQEARQGVCSLYFKHTERQGRQLAIPAPFRCKNREPS